jgi:hypothetical protein
LQKEPPTTLPLSPVPTKSLALRRLSNIQDLTSFRKLSQTLQAAELTYLRSRVRGGEVDVIEQLFYAGGPGEEWSHKGAGVRDNGVGYTWACITTTWWEKGGPAYGLVPGQGRVQTKGSAGKGLPLEVGMAVVRCANLRAVVSKQSWMLLILGCLASSSRCQLQEVAFHQRRVGRQGTCGVRSSTLTLAYQYSSA